MLLRKFLSRLGIGSAKIDLILPKKAYSPGEQINGCFLINGGTVEQKIKRIDCNLVMVDQSTSIEKVIDSATILSSRLILSKELNKISFTFNLPTSVRVSTENISYHFKTKLTFNEGVESRDEDIIQII
ncbi:sporulation protein [Domibacillus aminovorans]|uniref:Sporulation protein n=1 Tax=Domibacillus aminovorans TaxID=29332 RepID=A0A177KZ10_9BACI|nr:sporulation protein [Domibacillus aminovorans]OAH58590.1 sporulation protein [Domibacillus aminovorans]